MENDARRDATASPFTFLELLACLKDVQRRGWVLRGVHQPESVSDHTFLMAFMAWILPNIDEERRRHIKDIVMVHDIGEALAGDIIPHDNISREEKHLRESLALDYLSISLAPVNPTVAANVKALWSEFENGETDDAILARNLDIFERSFQAMVYEGRGGSKL